MNVLEPTSTSSPPGSGVTWGVVPAGGTAANQTQTQHLTSDAINFSGFNLAGIETLIPGVGQAIALNFAEFVGGAPVPAKLALPGLGEIDASIIKRETPIPFHVPGFFQVLGYYSGYSKGQAVEFPEFTIELKGLIVGIVFDLAKSAQAADAGAPTAT